MKNFANWYTQITSILFTVAIALFLFLYLNGRFGYKSSQKMPYDVARIEITGKVLPSLLVEDETGEVFLLDTLIKEDTYIGFSASWCRPCKFEYPNLDTLMGLQNSFDIMVLSIDEKAKSWTNSLHQHAYPQYRLVGKEETEELRSFLRIPTFGIPRYIMVNEDRIVLNPEASLSRYYVGYFQSKAGGQ